MSVLDDLRADFLPRLKQLKSTTVQLKETGSELTVYFRAVANTVQTDKYLPLMQDNKMEGYVELVLQRALSEDGKRIFMPKDKAVLMKDVDPETIVDIGNAILGMDEETREKEDAEKIAAGK